MGLLLAAAAYSQSPEIAGCPVFPPDNIWNTRVDNLPVHPNSAAFISSIGSSSTLHPDFGSGLYEGGPIGIPFATVPGGQPRVPVSFDYDEESDPGPYPIPAGAPIEGGSNSDGDRHVLVVDREDCRLYEVFDAHPQGNGSWSAGSGAVFDLRSNAFRPLTWTSADAAGLPILPGLVRWEEVAAGEIRHAIRFTARRTRREYVWPARHFASSITDVNVPAMGQRFRLKASFDTGRFSPQVRVILRALQMYGLILADNGSDWYLSGAPNDQWDNDTLRELKGVAGGNFEAVDVSSLMVYPDSGQARSESPARPAIAAVAHAASFEEGAVSPGLFVAIFGSGLGPAESVHLRLDGQGRVATNLGGTRVRFDGVPAPMIFSRSDQVNVIVPYVVAGRGRTALVVEYQGQESAVTELDVRASFPAFFTLDASGEGQAAVLNQDGSVNSAANPAERGSIVSFFGTGEGITLPAAQDGQLAGDVLWEPQLDVGVEIGGQPADLLYAGAAPMLAAGVMQINAAIPSSATAGPRIPAVLLVGEERSPAKATIAID